MDQLFLLSERNAQTLENQKKSPMLKRKRLEGVESQKLSNLQFSKSIEKSQEANDVYRIIFPASGIGDFRAYLLEIPSKTLDPFRNSEYNPNFCDKIPNYPEFLAQTNLFIFSKPVVVGSTMYALAMEELEFDAPFNLELLTLDLESQVKEWKVFLPNPIFDIKVTLKSVIASLCGRLYILGAYPCFGYIYDPHTKIWSILESPNGVTLSTDDVAFIAPLGDDKILVNEDGDGGYTNISSYIRIYDVPSNRWETCDGQCLGPHVCHIQMLDSPLVVHRGYNNPTLCFMDSFGTFYAFDWKTMKLFKGPVSGFKELCGVFEYGGFYCTSFLHFGGDLFCFCFCIYQSTEVGCRSQFLYTFMRVNINDEDSTLEGFIVGCLEDSMD